MPGKQAKGPRKRSKVLSSKKPLTAHAKALLEVNATESPLLLLPAEIRNRIYRYLLGDKDIHVKPRLTMPPGSDSPRHACPLICKSVTPDATTARLTIETGSEIGSAVWKHNHTACEVTFDDASTWTNAMLPLALLQVCRQIHAEASLIPFTTNTFLFDTTGDLKFLAKKLLQEQKAAIATVCISVTRFQAGFGTLDCGILAKLSGLRSITILAEFTKWPRSLTRDSGANLLTDIKRTLSRVAWSSAVVCLTSKTDPGYLGHHRYSARGLRAECRQLERTLLSSWADAPEKAREDELKEQKRERKIARRQERERKKQERAERKREKEIEKALEQEDQQDLMDARRAKAGLRQINVASYTA